MWYAYALVLYRLRRSCGFVALEDLARWFTTIFIAPGVTDNLDSDARQLSRSKECAFFYSS